MPFRVASKNRISRVYILLHAFNDWIIFVRMLRKNARFCTILYATIAILYGYFQPLADLFFVTSCICNVEQVHRKTLAKNGSALSFSFLQCEHQPFTTIHIWIWIIHKDRISNSHSKTLFTKLNVLFPFLIKLNVCAYHSFVWRAICNCLNA